MQELRHTMADQSADVLDIEEYNYPVILPANQVVPRGFNQMRHKEMESVYVYRLYTLNPYPNGRKGCKVVATGQVVEKPLAMQRPGQLKIDFYQVYENTMDNVYAREETTNMPTNPTYHYYVRIPSVLHMRSATYEEEEERDYFVATFRLQFGMHLWISSRLNLRYTEAYVQLLDDPIKCHYMMYYNSTEIQAIYPCYDPQDGTMLLGLMLWNDAKTFDLKRTFHRYQGLAIGERYIMDQTEDCIDLTVQGNNNLEILRSEVNFGPGSVAFYVCNGARLVVVDGPRQTHNRSLMQQGSLVIVHNVILTVDIPVRKYMDRLKKRKGKGQAKGEVGKGKKRRTYAEARWAYAFHNNEGTFNETHNTGLSEEEKANDPEEEGRTVSDWNRKVLFLGAIESQCNTAIWHLYLYGNGHAHLKFADGAVLQDVCPWITGWKLIRARHLFERSYESCFGPTQPHPDAPKPRWLFQVPADQYIFRRMLAIDDNVERPDVRKMPVLCPRDLNVPLMYSNGNQQIKSGFDDSVRRQLSFRYKLAFESHNKTYTKLVHINAHTMRMAPPPLYPPIWQKYPDQSEKLVYSRKKFTIENFSYSLNGAQVQFGGTKYQLSMMPLREYQWTKIDNVDADYWRDPECHDNKRFGDDYCWYQKVGDQYIGTTEVYCLKELPNEGEDEGAVGAAQVDQPQQVDSEDESEAEAEAEESEVEEEVQTSSQKSQKKRTRQKKKKKSVRH